MTPTQKHILSLIDNLNYVEFHRWFKNFEVMAFVQIESAFRSHSIRHEPSGVTSYGLMQVLDTSARDRGLAHDPAQMFDPHIGLRYGMLQLRWEWNFLQDHLRHDPSKEQWVAGYNEGVGNVLKGRADHAYVRLWQHAAAYWQGVIVE
jgi:soluble lytic murein transglycosylase-like protein